MSKAVTIKNKTPSGEILEATYLPEQGMNMCSFKRGGIEVIDQSTKALFEERFAGLGALIGPHFHHRNANVIPPIKDESLFPHIARIKAKGIQEPFSHGIGRYAPWKADFTETGVKAVITGKDTWNGVPLADLEGQNFTMKYQAEMTPQGLQISLSVVSDSDSVVGIHYYFHLPKGTGTIISQVQKDIFDGKTKIAIPNSWDMDLQRKLSFSLDHPADYTFYPYPDPLNGAILLDAKDYQLRVTYNSSSQENCWQLYHPENASFVCIEPLSAQDPRHPNLTVSSIQIKLEILTENSAA